MSTFLGCHGNVPLFLFWGGQLTASASAVLLDPLLHLCQHHTSCMKLGGSGGARWHAMADPDSRAKILSKISNSTILLHFDKS